eukprot:GHVL01003647.1.p1 GENE.GHVL01003647.1~~GHVL01003647.1.p1  ORF type:complete len:337 (-),score=35.14 GHVL01003647.1:700-1710(-)
MAHIEYGDYVIFQNLDGKRCIRKIAKSASCIRIGKVELPVSSVVGIPWNSAIELTGKKRWEISNQSNTPLDHFISETSVAGDNFENCEQNGPDDANVDQKRDSDELANTTQEINNRFLNDDNSAQALSSEDIAQMKREGITGSSLIAELASNSRTFKRKTIFSQKKWLAKKQKKHLVKIVCKPATIMNICETYFNKSQATSCGLRFDYLSLMINLGDVRCSKCVATLDLSNGLLNGAVLQQLAGDFAHNLYFSIQINLGQSVLYRLFTTGVSNAVTEMLGLDPTNLIDTGKLTDIPWNLVHQTHNSWSCQHQLIKQTQFTKHHVGISLYSTGMQIV